MGLCSEYSIQAPGEHDMAVLDCHCLLDINATVMEARSSISRRRSFVTDRSQVVKTLKYTPPLPATSVTSITAIATRLRTTSLYNPTRLARIDIPGHCTNTIRLRRPHQNHNRRSAGTGPYSASHKCEPS